MTLALLAAVLRLWLRGDRRPAPPPLVGARRVALEQIAARAAASASAAAVHAEMAGARIDLTLERLYAPRRDRAALFTIAAMWTRPPIGQPAPDLIGAAA